MLHVFQILFLEQIVRYQNLMKQAGILPVRVSKCCTRRAQCAADVLL